MTHLSNTANDATKAWGRLWVVQVSQVTWWVGKEVRWTPENGWTNLKWAFRLNTPAVARPALFKQLRWVFESKVGQLKQCIARQDICHHFCDSLSYSLNFWLHDLGCSHNTKDAVFTSQASPFILFRCQFSGRRDCVGKNDNEVEIWGEWPLIPFLNKMPSFLLCENPRKTIIQELISGVQFNHFCLVAKLFVKGRVISIQIEAFGGKCVPTYRGNVKSWMTKFPWIKQISKHFLLSQFFHSQAMWGRCFKSELILVGNSLCLTLKTSDFLSSFLPKSVIFMILFLMFPCYLTSLLMRSILHINCLIKSLVVEFNFKVPSSWAIYLFSFLFQMTDIKLHLWADVINLLFQSEEKKKKVRNI